MGKTQPMENLRTRSLGVELDDPARLVALARIRVESSGAAGVLDRLTALVTALLDVPMSFLTLVTPESEIFVSVAGIDRAWQARGPVPVTDSFCQRAVRSGGPFVIGDARTDPLARGVDSVLDEEIVAYLGVPLVDSSGQLVGSFCAADTAAREWSERDIRVLTDLAATAMASVEHRSEPLASVDARGLDRGGLNIAAVSRRTGVASDTLRKWERRYGVLHPRRTAGGQRRYDDHDVSRVEWLRDRLTEGFRIGAAAALLEPAKDVSAETVEELCTALIAATQAGDPGRLAGLVEQTFTLHPVAVAIEEIVAPALRAVDGCEHGVAGIAEEHLLSAVVRSRLERMLSDRRAGVRGKAVLACAPGERHELGLLAVAVLLQADGWLVAYLGAALPIDATLALARQIDADVVCLSATLPESLDRLAAELEAAPAGPRVVVGGSGVLSEAGAAARLPAQVLPHGLTEVVAQIQALAPAR